MLKQYCSKRILQVISTFSSTCRTDTLNALPIFHARACSYLYQSKDERKQTVEKLKRWNTENDMLFGPLLDPVTLAPLKSGKRKSVGPKSASNSHEKAQPKKRGRPKGSVNKVKSVAATINSDTEEMPNKKGRQVSVNMESQLDRIGTFENDKDKTYEKKKGRPKGSVAKMSLPAHSSADIVFDQPDDEENSSDEEFSINLKDEIGKVLAFPLTVPDVDTDYKHLKYEEAMTVDVAELQKKYGTSAYYRTPSVSTILNRTATPESQFFLKRWIKGKTEELGAKGFAAYQQMTLDKGSTLHSCIQGYLSGVPETHLNFIPEIEGHWKSIEHLWKDISEVQSMESPVKHPNLEYHGVFDCVASYKGIQCAIDWKTSANPKPSLRDTYDNPLQLAAYVGAMNFDENYRLQVDNAMLVVAYEDGSPAHVHFLSRKLCEDYWQLWKKRLHQYWQDKLLGEDS